MLLTKKNPPGAVLGKAIPAVVGLSWTVKILTAFEAVAQRRVPAI